MTTLTFYGGINEIGGNKILLEDEGHALMLDFGFPYKRHKLFYEEYLKPRSGTGLLDPLTMGLLPPLEGIYREDLETADLWQEFRGSFLYRRLDSVEGVLLSHAHLDHSGHISFLKSSTVCGQQKWDSSAVETMETSVPTLCALSLLLSGRQRECGI
jgi:ribonuclease J